MSGKIRIKRLLGVVVLAVALVVVWATLWFRPLKPLLDSVPQGTARVSYQLVAPAPSTGASAAAVAATPSISPSPGAGTMVAEPLPAALVFDVQDSRRAWRWVEQSVLANPLLSPIAMGVVPEHALRLEEFGGTEGAVLGEALRRILGARARLEWYRAHGSRGWVLSFDRAAVGFPERFLGVVIERSAKRAIDVLDARSASSAAPDKRLPSIIEIALVGRKFSVLESGGRIFVGLLPSTILRSASEGAGTWPRSSSASVGISVALEAWLDSALPLLARSDAWPVQAALNLSETQDPELEVESSAWIFSQLHAVDSSLAQAIPVDVTSALAIGLGLPDAAAERWYEALSGKKEPDNFFTPNGSVAFVWDVSPQYGSRGAALALALRNDDPVMLQRVRGIFSEELSSASCADGKLLILGTHELLVTRMRDSCQGANKSMASRQLWPTGDPRVVALINPQLLTGELVRFGIESRYPQFLETAGASVGGDKAIAIKKLSELALEQGAAAQALVLAGTVHGRVLSLRSVSQASGERAKDKR